VTNSRRKGAAGEREFSTAVRDALGVRLLRRLDQCRAGGFDLAPEPDDGSPAAAWLRAHAVEVKRHRGASAAEVAGWWAQTLRQADAAGLEPMLAFRADRQPWHIVVALDTLAAVTVPAGAERLAATVSLEGLAALARTGHPPTEPGR